MQGLSRSSLNFQINDIIEIQDRLRPDQERLHFLNRQCILVAPGDSIFIARINTVVQNAMEWVIGIECKEEAWNIEGGTIQPITWSLRIANGGNNSPERHLIHSPLERRHFTVRQNPLGQYEQIQGTGRDFEAARARRARDFVVSEGQSAVVDLSNEGAAPSLPNNPA